MKQLRMVAGVAAVLLIAGMGTHAEDCMYQEGTGAYYSIEPVSGSNSASGNKSTVSGGQNNTASGDRTVVGGGCNNLASAKASTIAGGKGNEGSAHGATIGGGEYNEVITLGNRGTLSTIAGGYCNTAAREHSTVGGGQNNQALGQSSVVAGGSYNLVGTAVNGHGVICGGADNTNVIRLGFIGGGSHNACTWGEGSVICGGKHNETASGFAFIGGGQLNYTVGTQEPYCTIVGGYANLANGWAATIGGGRSNLVTGSFSTVPGGEENEANGKWSFAAGRRAKADHKGAFVWADGTEDEFPTTADNQFLIEAAGGVGIGMNTPAHPLHMASGAHVTSGGAWTDASSRDIKENFTAVNGREILDKVSQLPVTRWNYKATGEAEQHIGPVAEDFHDAFGVGSDDKHLAALDTAGIALAAIQALNEHIGELNDRIHELEQRIAQQAENASTE